jgi:hypothetical protein
MPIEQGHIKIEYQYIGYLIAFYFGKRFLSVRCGKDHLAIIECVYQ